MSASEPGFFQVLCLLPSVNLRRGLGKKALLIFAVAVENCARVAVR